MCTHDDATLYDGIGVLVEPDLDPRLGLQKPEDEVLFGVDDGCGRGGSQRGWRWVETNDRGGIPWEALARSCSVGVMGGLTIGLVMMRCTLVAMVAEFHVVIPLDCFASLCRALLWCCRACVSWPSDDDGCFPSLRSRRSRLETTCVCL